MFIGLEDASIQVTTLEGSPALVLHGHRDWVTSMVFHNGTLYTASADHTVRCWRGQDWACIRILHSHTDAVRSLSVHGSGGGLFSGGADKVVLNSAAA